jgi:Fic family protein
MLKTGPSGFTGDLSAHKYQQISKASPATTTRDLRDLVEKNILYKTGERKSTRYYLNFKPSRHQ